MVDNQQIVAQVAIPGLRAPLYYSAATSTETISIGTEVEVELGRRQAKGWVIGTKSLSEAEQLVSATIIENQKKTADSKQLSLLSTNAKPKLTLKPILAATPAFSKDQVQLFKWIAEYYGANISEVIESAIPKRSETKPELAIVLSETAHTQLKASNDSFSKLLKRAPVQLRIISFIAEVKRPVLLAELRALSPSASTALTALEKRGLVERVPALPTIKHCTTETSSEAVFSSPKPDKLTSSQQHALENILQAIEKRTFKPILLHGVTGSGKTEVYLQAIQQVVQQGKSAVVIVPEIALTPQLLDRFESRINTPLAVLHSQVGSRQRWSSWQSLLEGTSLVAVGARSAVFAPVKDLALVIVDEEHESSYKQSDNLRYHARDIAVMRAKFANCPVILGSATPSFESMLNVKHGRYKLLEMPERVTTRPLPELEIVDLRKIKKKELPSPSISPQLFAAAKHAIEKGGQVVILYNRRGFSSYLQCETCGEAINCPQCSVALTYHKKKHVLLCHYCNHSSKPPEHCSFCRDPKLTRDESISDKEARQSAAVGTLLHMGSGTERVVDEIQELFPEARIARMDRDTMGRKGAYRETLTAVRRGEVDILIGTQMIAKGHDLPGVTLVGVLDADIGLHLPDFRANEKVFQLITQAAGRAGRGDTPGRVVVQTREPHHSTIVALSTGRFKAFARFELERRHALGYPPWNGLLRIVVSSPMREHVYTGALTITNWLNSWFAQQPTDSPPAVLGPAPAPYEKLRGRFRWHFLVKSESRKLLSLLAQDIASWKQSVKSDLDLRITVDVDPVDML